MEPTLSNIQYFNSIGMTRENFLLPGSGVHVHDAIGLLSSSDSRSV